MQKQLKRNLVLLNIFSFFQFFAFWQPIKQLYLYAIGANEAALGIGVAIWTIAQFVFEMPSGYVSDKFGKKKSFYIGQICRAFAFLIIFAIPAVPAYYTGLALIGASAAFVSGSDKALLHDTLQVLGRKKEYIKLSGRMIGLGIIGIVVSGFVALPIAHFGYKYNYLLSIVPQFAMIATIWLMYEPKHHIREMLHNPARDMWVALRRSMGTRTLQLLVFMAATMQFVKHISQDFGQAFLYSFIASAATVSFVWVLGMAAQATSNFIAYYVRRHSSALKLLVFVLFLGMSFGPHSLSVVLYVLMLLPIGIAVIEAEESVQKAAPDHLRATTLSGMNMFIRLVETVPFVALGLLMASRGPVFGFRIASSALTALAMALILASYINRLRKSKGAGKTIQ